MTTETRDTSIHDRFVNLLKDPSARWRMLALHLLSDGYVESDQIFSAVLDGWDRWGVEVAFPEFPMVSFLPVPANQIQVSCETAAAMVAGRKLTAPESRCAGKLIEQLLRLPASDLEPHTALLAETKSKGKIFFRVDLQGLADRIQLAGCTADQCANVLNNAVEQLSQDNNHGTAFRQGLAALEAIRRNHPDYVDLNSVLKTSPDAVGPNRASLRITLQSLTDFAHPGSETYLHKHALSEDESIYSTVVDALVRSGTRAAAEVLLETVDQATGENRKWIARGLQRLQLRGLAAGIAACRDQTRDPYIWLMLLIAEVRQFQPESMDRLAYDLSRLQSPSEPLLDVLSLYLHIHRDDANLPGFKSVVEAYVTRVGMSTDCLHG